MPVIRTDGRSVDYTDLPELRGDLAARCASLHSVRIGIAKDLVQIHESRAYLAESCSSAVHFAIRHGIDAFEARDLLNLGLALKALDSLEQDVRDGRISLRNGAHLGRLARVEGALRPEEVETWLEHARREKPSALGKRVKRRLEEVRQETTHLVEVTAFVPPEVKEGFQRLRVLLSRKARRMLSDGEAFAQVVEFCLQQLDPDRQGTARRRMPPTHGSTHRRVPAEVQRELRRVSDDGCEFPDCPHSIFIQNAHVGTRKRDRGGQEFRELGRLCWPHHVLEDAGEIVFVGRREEDGRAVFANREGQIFGPHGPPDPVCGADSDPPPGGEADVGDAASPPPSPDSDPDARDRLDRDGTGEVRDRWVVAHSAWHGCHLR